MSCGQIRGELSVTPQAARHDLEQAALESDVVSLDPVRLDVRSRRLRAGTEIVALHIDEDERLSLAR